MAIRTTVTTAIAEESTVAFTVAFADEDGAAVVPDSIQWTLHNDSGTVINSREDVSVAPAASITIVLSGDDLSVTAATGRQRLVLIEWVYTSDIGASLPGKHEIVFEITAIVGVP